MARRVKILGQRGRWVAEVEGRMLAVLHSTHMLADGAHFAPFDQGDPRGGAKYQEFEEALRSQDLVVVQRDTSATDFARKGYVGVFRFADLRIDYSEGVRLRLTARYADPAP